MPQAYTQSRLPRAIVGGWFARLSVFLFVAITFSSLVWPDGAGAQPTPDELLIEFQGADTPPEECMGIDRPEEALSCFWDNGFPYASLCPQSLYSPQEEICPGPQVRIADFNFSDEIPFRNSLIQSLGGFERGQFYNHRQVLDFIGVLRDRLGVTDAEITFEQAGLSSVRMLVDGRAPRSSISAGFYIDSFDSFVGTLTGRHFVGRNAPGFLEYYLQGASNRLSELGASIPISVSPESTTRLGVRAYDAEGHYADLRGARLSLSVAQYAPRAGQLPRIASYGGEIVEETFRAAGFTPQDDEYLSAFVNWELDAPDFFDDNDLRLSAYWLAGHGLSSKLSFSGSSVSDLSDNSEAVLRNFSHMELMLGSISTAPLSERIFLGGENLRGFYPMEIGRTTNGNFTNWGERWSLTSQFELLWPIQKKFSDVSVGMHADLGLIFDDNFDIASNGSIGLILEFGSFEDINIQLTLSRNNFSRNNLSLSMNVLN